MQNAVIKSGARARLRALVAALRDDQRGLVTTESTILMVCILVACVVAWGVLGDVILRIITGD